MKKPFAPIPLHNPAEAYCLKDTQIDLWSFMLDAPLPKSHQEILSEAENLRANRFHFEHHQHHFRRARLSLRLTLAKYLNKAPESLVFDYGKHGKPYLPDYPELQFNLSHSGTRALLAIGKTHALGVDIEQFSARPYEGIGSHVFSDLENTQLKNLPKALKPLMFFNTWAQKEAFIKLLGLGLAYPTKELTINSLSRTAYQFTDPIHQKTCAMLAFMSTTGYAAAVCYHPSIESIRFLHHSE